MKAKEVEIKEHMKELASAIEIPILINRDSYEKLCEIGKRIKKLPEKVIEGFINDIYYHLKEIGEL